MPPKGWRKKDHPSKPQQPELTAEEKELVREEDRQIDADTPGPETPSSEAISHGPGDALFRLGVPHLPKLTVSTPAEPEDDDEESEFITPRDVAKTKVPGGVSPMLEGPAYATGRAVAAFLHKVDDVEYAIFKHPVFVHTEADEQIQNALGDAIAHELPVKLRGLVLCAILYGGSQALKVAIMASDRAKAAARAESAPGRQRNRK